MVIQYYDQLLSLKVRLKPNHKKTTEVCYYLVESENEMNQRSVQLQDIPTVTELEELQNYIRTNPSSFNFFTIFNSFYVEIGKVYKETNEIIGKFNMSITDCLENLEIIQINDGRLVHQKYYSVKKFKNIKSLINYKKQQIIYENIDEIDNNLKNILLIRQNSINIALVKQRKRMLKQYKKRKFKHKRKNDEYYFDQAINQHENQNENNDEEKHNSDC
jgi:hypothetical protein